MFKCGTRWISVEKRQYVPEAVEEALEGVPRQWRRDWLGRE